MNFNLPFIPERPAKPRESGVTMMMDKGLCPDSARQFLESSGIYTDFIKLGFGTSYLTPRLEEKLSVYKNAGIKAYFGGTLFEAFIARGMFEDYRRLLDTFKMDFAEVSDGTLPIPLDEKLEYIRILSQQVTVLSEVGCKLPDRELLDSEWITMMKAELEAGSWKVIAEARESGKAGIYNSDGSANDGLVDLIKTNIDPNKIIWEAPNKEQQVYFIKQFGANVNLGNISPTEVISLETLRAGLRADTLFDFLPEEIQKQISAVSTL